MFENSFSDLYCFLSVGLIFLDADSCYRYPDSAPGAYGLAET